MLAVRLVTVVVANVTEEVAVKFPVTKFVVVALFAVRFVKNAVTLFNRVAKKLELVAFVAVSDEMVVVASVEVPTTTNLPDVVALPFASTAKFELAVQLLPFQKSVWLFDDPLAIVPEIVVQ